MELDHLYSSVCTCCLASNVKRVWLCGTVSHKALLFCPVYAVFTPHQHQIELALQSTVQDRLYSLPRVRQEQRAWLIELVEGLRPLPRHLARRALQALVSADAFERFLAASFPASKVLLACRRFSYGTLGCKCQPVRSVLSRDGWRLDVE